jgi:Tol biopolymer transport system component
VTAAGAVEGDFLIEQVVAGGERLLRFATGGSEQIAVGTSSGQGDLSADKTRLVFWRPFDNRLFRAAGDGSGETVLTSGAINYGPRWSANGERVVFTREYGGGESSREIAIIGADGAGLTRLTTNGTIDEDPHLSPDGTRIVFVSQRDGNRELYVMNADGSNQLRLTNSAGLEGSPSWSPDGTRIAYVSNASGSDEAWVMNADGTGAVRLTSVSGTANQLVRWSPDGRRVAYRRTVSGVGEIWTVRVTGLDARRLRSVGAGVTAEYVRTWRAR